MAISKVVFPQADSINKIIDMLINFSDKQIFDKKYFVRYFNVVPRQSFYYYDALLFLGIVNENQQITPLGKKLREFDDLDGEICHVLRNTIVNKPVFKQVYEYYLLNKKIPKKSFISDLIRIYFNLSISTCDRRTSTVKKWIKWTIDVI